MDGTLTRAIHDFDAIRTTLGLPADMPILEAIERQPPAQAALTHQRLDTLEFDIAAQASQQPGATELLDLLQQRGCRLGILTRNGKAIAHATLEACGLDHYFAADDVVGRDCCAPKPDPVGIYRLMQRWSASPTDTVMVGDYLFDLQAGQDAGAYTVHMAVDEQREWPALTTLKVMSLSALSAQLRSPATEQ